MGTVIITAEEYRELVIKAYKYDKLRKKMRSRQVFHNGRGYVI